MISPGFRFMLLAPILFPYILGHAQSVPCAAITRNPRVLEALIDSHATDVEPDPQDSAITAGELASLRFSAIVIQPGDALYVEYRGRDFTVEAGFASGDKTAFDSSPKGSYDQWRKGILPLDAYRRALNQRLVRLRAIAKSPDQVLLRNIRIIRAGRPVFEFASLASYGKPRVKKAVERSLPCAGFDEVSASQPRASDFSVENPSPLRSLSGDFLRPMLPLPPYPMAMQSTTTPSVDLNHFRFTGKELDDETGLYNFGARYYNPELGRYITPDWSARPMPVPYAILNNPQSLNLYTYGRNNPTSRRDSDGHCIGDDCKDVKVEVKVVAPGAIVKNEKTADGTFVTGVRAKVQYTLTDKGKPLPKVDLHEDNKDKITLNGQPRQPQLHQQDSPTNSQGQVNDTYGLLTESGKPLQPADANGLADTLSSNAVTQSGTQTLTFTMPGGPTCSCTVDRSITNENKDGTNNGANYTFKTSEPSQPVKTPKDEQQD